MNELKDQHITYFHKKQRFETFWNSIMFGNIVNITTHKPINL